MKRNIADLDLPLLRKGKVREVYDLKNKLLMVASDRVSAFDHVLPNTIPNKGKILTKISTFWFENTKDIVDNHLITTDFDEIKKNLPKKIHLNEAYYKDRMMLVRKANRVDFECVVRGYIAGSMWKEYLETGQGCGYKLPEGLKQAQKLPKPIFTPATKADTGHDENISFEQMKKMMKNDKLADKLKDISLRLYEYGEEYMKQRGIILADTKFEFGLIGDKIILIDEVLTPDSSRFWDVKNYKIGESPVSLDKQFLRDYLEKTKWDKKSAPPQIPHDIVLGATEKYKQALNRVVND